MEKTKTSKISTTSLVVLLLASFAITAFAGLQLVTKVAAAGTVTRGATPAGNGYIEEIGTLGGAQYLIRIPDPVGTWNGRLLVYCHGWNRGIEPTVSSFNASAHLSINRGEAFAASTFGAGGYPIPEAVDRTRELTEYVVANYNVKGKIFLLGLSMGGNIALQLGAKYPELYSGVIDVSGGKNLTYPYAKSAYVALNDTALTAELMKLGPGPLPIRYYPCTSLQDYRNFVGNLSANVVTKCGGTPEQKPLAYQSLSPVYNATNLKIPVITIHGSLDGINFLATSLEYQAAVAKAGSSSFYRLYVVDGGGHVDATVIAEMGRRIVELYAWSDALGVNNPTFSIMQITDLQHLAFLSPTLYNDTTSWIVNNSAVYNLKMVVYTGDFIDAFVTNPPPPPVVLYNTSQIAQEWVVANAAMSKLLNAGIPYCWDAGNHDQTPFGNASGTMRGSSYPAFNASVMRSKPYWVSDIYDSKNTAVKFAYNNYPFMMINVEFMANSSAIGWMKGLLDKNTGANVIVTTHGYLNANADYNSSSSATVAWNNAFKATLNSYPNVFLALSGHINGVNMTRVGNRQEILFDRQEANNQTGAASVRIYTFNLTSKKVDASTYCLDTKTWLTDNYNQFTFSASTLIPLASLAPAASAFCNVTLVGGGSWYFFAHSNGGFGPHLYQWYEGTALLAGQTSMVLPVTKTSLGIYTFYCRVTDSQGTTTTSNTVTLTVVS